GLPRSAQGVMSISPTKPANLDRLLSPLPGLASLPGCPLRCIGGSRPRQRVYPLFFYTAPLRPGLVYVFVDRSTVDPVRTVHFSASVGAVFVFSPCSSRYVPCGGFGRRTWTAG